MPATPYSYRQYSSGSTFSVPFPYLLKAHVKVYLGYNLLAGTFSSELVDGVGFNWTSATQIQTTSPLGAGQVLTVIRLTPNNTRLVDWSDGGKLTAGDLDTADLQNLYVVQEQQDRNDLFTSQQNANVLLKDGTVAMEANFSAGGNRITNLATPAADTDAVNRAYVNNIVANGIGDGNKGDISVSNNGNTWVINGNTIVNSDISPSAAIDKAKIDGTAITTVDIETVTSSMIANNTIVDGDVNASANIASSKLAFTQSGTGALQRSVESKLRDVISIKDFGATGDGVADDTTAVTAAKNAISSQVNGVLLASGGEFASTGTIWSNNVSPTSMPMTRPGVLGVFEGTQASPDQKDRGPSLWVQKYTKYDSNGDRFNHNAGAVFGEVNILGTGAAGSNDTEGTWIGILGNSVLNGTNQGTSGAPDYDAFGSTIGVAGFARTTGYPGDGNIACGVWGYAEGPTLDATTQANLPATNWSLVGVESNIQINHQDIGEQSAIVGKGSSVGFLAFNYRTPNTGRVDWTFGIALAGNPNDNNFGSTNIDNWNGFYCGIFIDKIKAKGIRFGQYMKTGSYGIYFPDTYAGSMEPAAAIYLGNSKIAMGQYVGTTFNNGDFWHNGGQIYWRYNSETRRALTHNQATGVLPTSMRIDFQTNGAYNQFSIGAVASSVNYLSAFGAATTNTPALAGVGSDANIDIELRPKGSGRVWIGEWSSNGDANVNGYITVKDSLGVTRKIATIA